MEQNKKLMNFEEHFMPENKILRILFYISFPGVLTITLIILKLTIYNEWLWCIVFLPLMVSLFISLLVALAIKLLLNYDKKHFKHLDDEKIINISEMGKLIKRLQEQLKSSDHKKDAEYCIKIYNWIKDTDKEGKVWSSRWEPLIDVTFKGFPSDERIYKPNITGYTLLKGIENNN